MGTYAVIGDPIDHSLSPLIHNAAFRKLEMDSAYISFRIRKGELQDGLESLAAAGIAGFNVTIPHKVDIMKLLDETSKECATVGACNTVKIKDGKMMGHNTDVQGFLSPLEQRSVKFESAKALVLGTGGAARAVVSGLASKGVRITVAGRTIHKAQDVALLGRDGAASIDFANAASVAAESDIIVNATPLGMNDEQSPIPADSICPKSVVYDIVYRPIKTALIKAATERGALVIYGYEMLLAQAALSFEIWHNTPAPYDAMKQALLGMHAS